MDETLETALTIAQVGADYRGKSRSMVLRCRDILNTMYPHRWPLEVRRVWAPFVVRAEIDWTVADSLDAHDQTASYGDQMILRALAGHELDCDAQTRAKGRVA